MGIPKPVLYTGTFRHNRDGKGRLTIPAKWRTTPKKGSDEGDAGEEYFLAVPSPKERCVVVMPPARAQKFLDRIAESSLTNDAEQEAIMDLSPMIQMLEPDSQGRISLDEALLSYSGIHDAKDVILVGNVNTFSIWSQDNHAVRFPSSPEEMGKKFAQSIPKLGGI
jgi:division/cell wall cluster transcriptional repressor MraZ